MNGMIYFQAHTLQLCRVDLESSGQAHRLCYSIEVDNWAPMRAPDSEIRIYLERVLKAAGIPHETLELARRRDGLLHFSTILYGNIICAWPRKRI